MELRYEEIEKLAVLSRIKLPRHEAEGMRSGLGAVLEYVSLIKKAVSMKKADASVKYIVRNAVREDSGAHCSGEFSDILLKSAPARDKKYIKVKKVL